MKVIENKLCIDTHMVNPSVDVQLLLDRLYRFYDKTKSTKYIMAQVIVNEIIVWDKYGDNNAPSLNM